MWSVTKVPGNDLFVFEVCAVLLDYLAFEVGD
jgi:hypothetical protein